MTWINVALLVFNLFYLVAVIRVAGMRFDNDYLLWHVRMRQATIGSVLTEKQQ